jgi:metal-responsive CopG/Arc/MetJ family transcriptional regulator
MAGRGRPKTDAKPVMVRLPETTIQAIDEVRKNTKGIPSRPEVIRRIVDKWLSENSVEDGFNTEVD